MKQATALALALFFTLLTSSSKARSQSTLPEDLYNFALHWNETGVPIGEDQQDFEVFDLLCLLGGDCPSEDTTLWFVDNAAPPGGDGSMQDPFDSLTPVNGVGGGGDLDGPGDIIFLFQGGSAYDQGMVLEENQRLIGQGVDLVVSDQTLVPGSPGQRPTISAQGEDSITLALNTKVSGLEVVADGGRGIVGLGIGAAEIVEVTVTGADASDAGKGLTPQDAPPAIQIDNGRLTLQDSFVLGGSGANGNDAAGDSDGGKGGSGVFTENGSTIDLFGSTLIGGPAGDSTENGGHGAFGGDGVAGNGSCTINATNSTLMGGRGGKEGTTGFNFSGAGGAGVSAATRSVINLMNSTIIGGPVGRAGATFLLGGVTARASSVVDIKDCSITAGTITNGVQLYSSTLTIADSTVTGGEEGGTAISLDISHATLENMTVKGGKGGLHSGVGFQGGDGLSIRENSTVTLEDSTVTGGEGGDEASFGGGSGGVGLETSTGSTVNVINTPIRGGAGGLGGDPDSVTSGGGGWGLFVGDAIVDVLDSPIEGGNGSDDAGAGFDGGEGGVGVFQSGGVTTVRGTTTITAGRGGRGGSGKEGGEGGIGVQVSPSGGTFHINSIPVIGGEGGFGDNGGRGGNAVEIGFSVTQNTPGTVNVNDGATVTAGRGGDGNAGNGGMGGTGVRVYENGTGNLNNSTVRGGDGGNSQGGGVGGLGGLGTDTTPSVAFDPGVINNNGSTISDGANGVP